MAQRTDTGLGTELKWHQSVLENETARFHHRLLKLAVDLGLNVRIYQDVSLQAADAYDKSHSLRDPFAQLVRCPHLPRPSLSLSLSLSLSRSLVCRCWLDARVEMVGGSLSLFGQLGASGCWLLPRAACCLLPAVCSASCLLLPAACFRWRRGDAGEMVWWVDGVRWRLGIGE